ncbi:unnamed protein product [Peronospora destructor]|uniref:Reverse transcriptase n=1 Tax=Peronospora destructor TaxID=86335 RepID=A0AAV0UE18_9STRA|nr:unnamed protein product [Peronospora destructor]
MPCNSNTNNMAEYTALLLGARAAADHGAMHLRIEGDSNLVIQQVGGIFATWSAALRRLRDQVKIELARVGLFTLHHIDRKANAHADRLANRGLDLRRAVSECADHPNGDGCTYTGDVDLQLDTTPVPPHPAPEIIDDDTEGLEEVESMEDIDDGDVYAVMRLGPDAVPQRRPRLRLRKLTDDKDDAARALVERLGMSLAAKISDASDWETVEGYITALPHTLYDQLQPFSQTRWNTEVPSREARPVHAQREKRRTVPRPATDDPVGRSKGGTKGRVRPPRVTQHHREHRLDEALDALHAVGHSTPGDRSAINKARRRVGRINSAIEQQRLRHRFDTEEKACVENIFSTHRVAEDAALDTGAATTASEADDGICPISSDQLWRYFDGVNTPCRGVDANAPVGTAFMAQLPAASRLPDLLIAAPTADDIEDQLQDARGASSPGLDGVGYDVYKRRKCHKAGRWASSGCFTRKAHAMTRRTGGPRDDPANWRPIFLQQAIYKLYTGVLARKLARWMDANDRHAPGKRGFRAVNGCGEHNFLAAMLIDNSPQAPPIVPGLRLGVPPEYVSMCKGLYDDAAFVVGNAADGTTAPIRQQVGVFQGCPLSPPLFNVAIGSLLFALKTLPTTGVQMSAADCPGASVYADDLKIFSGTEDGITRQHSLVVDFLRWTGMAANSQKCSTMTVQRNSNYVLRAGDIGLTLDNTAILSLTMDDSYKYLGIGDGFDHVRRRVELAPALNQLKQDATPLLQSGLAPWQVIKAVKVYLYPRVECTLRHLRPFAQQLEGFDRHLVLGLRHLLRLPTNSTTAFFYAPVSRGGLRLLPLTELHGALQVAHGWQMLNLPDPAIQRIARQQLRQIAEAHYKLDVVLISVKTGFPTFSRGFSHSFLELPSLLAG